MKDERTYKFIEEFLKWNFGKLLPIPSNMIYGSPSVALHLWLNLSKMHIDCKISIVLFEDPHQEAHNAAVEEFLIGNCNVLSDVPVHFVTSVCDEGFDVHFDSRGDLMDQDRRIAFIHGLEKSQIGRLVRKYKIHKALHGTMVLNLRTVMARMERMYLNWSPGGKNSYWKQLKSYHELVCPLGDVMPKVTLKTGKRILRK